MKSIYLMLSLLLFTSCATAVPGIKIATSPAEVSQCEAVPTFVPLTCAQAASCEECLKVMSSEASKLSGNTILLNQTTKECSAKDLTATVYRCK